MFQDNCMVGGDMCSEDLEVFLVYGFNGKQLDDLDDDCIGFHEEDTCEISNSSKFQTAFSTIPADQFQVSREPINDHWELQDNMMQIVADCECGHPGCVFQSSLYSETAKVLDDENDFEICVNNSFYDSHQCYMREAQAFSYFYYNHSEFVTQPDNNKLAQTRTKRKFSA